jgi:hypothetical protein
VQASRTASQKLPPPSSGKIMEVPLNGGTLPIDYTSSHAARHYSKSYTFKSRKGEKLQRGKAKRRYKIVKNRREQRTEERKK